MSRAFLEQGEGRRAEAGRVGETRWRQTQTAHLKAKPSLYLSLSCSRSLATLVTPTTSTPVQDNISLILPLVFHLASTHLAGTRGDKFTSRLTDLAGPKRRQYYIEMMIDLGYAI